MIMTKTVIKIRINDNCDDDADVFDDDDGVIQVHNREEVPADMVVVGVHERYRPNCSGACYVETKSLDGEYPQGCLLCFLCWLFGRSRVLSRVPP